MSDIKVFAAHKIVTMDPRRPVASHVAVRDGRILAVGDAEEVSAWGDFPLDSRFADKVLLPGFVEGHAHVLAGAMWRYLYIGYHDRVDPAGITHPGLTDIGQAIEKLRQAEAALTDAEAPLIAWGFDPIFLTGERLNRHHLDSVSASRPIAVVHSNFHLLTANTAALSLAQYGPETQIVGVALEEDGHPHGELREFAAMFPVMRRLGIDFGALARSEDGIRAYGEVARRCGVTTVTDLIADLEDGDVRQLLEITGEASYPIRLVPALNGHAAPAYETAERALALKHLSTEKLRLGAVKLLTDGSIQGFTAQVNWPGYFKGPDHGIWNMAPEQLYDTVDNLNGEDIQLHIHVNGDKAIDMALDALERTLGHHRRPDHRHTLQHCQMAGPAQFRRMQALGVGVNLFANHLYYFGDQHRDITLGPDRAQGIDGCATALAHGVPLAIHSDAPVTPMGPLFTAWCAVNRETASGDVLGEAERISVEQALHAVTLGAAHSLKMDGDVGSIEVGKRADFAVLEEDPTACAPEALKDIAVHGTVLGGEETAP